MITTHFAVATPGDSGSGMLREAMHEHFVHRVDPGRSLPAVLNPQSHLTLAQIRAEDAAVVVLSHVRNPFDYYLSRYLHLVRNRRYRGTFRDHVLRDWPRHCADDTAGHYYPTYTAYFRHYTTRASDAGVESIPDARIIRFERFAEDVARLLGACCPELGAGYFAGWFPVAYQQWRRLHKLEDIEQVLRAQVFDAELRAWVEHEDADLLARFGYTFTERTDGG